MSKKLRRGEFGASETNKAVGAMDVTYTIGAEAANVINVAGQLIDGNGDAVQEAHMVTVMLSDAATGLGISAAAPDGGVAIGTDGEVVNSLTANLLLLVQTEADGSFDVDITESGVATWYMVTVLKDEQVVSDAITFA